MKKTDKVTWKGYTLTVEQIMDANERCSCKDSWACGDKCPLYRLDGESIDCGYALPGFALEALKLAVEDS